ncbi:hypothetical protein SLS58_002270 [Diplodia intermedia]|uniref:Thioesterase family protein n=1 Tax=Diplodia intermedia TaxID=856260 RepID=A0ABR3TZ11_9PEZI
MDEALQGKLREELDRLPVVREFEAKATAEGDGHVGRGGDTVGAGGAEWVEVEPWGVGTSASSSSPSLLATAAAVLGGGRSRRDSGVVLVEEEEERDGKSKGGGGWFGGWGKERQQPAVAVPQTTMMADERHLVAQTLAAMKGFGPARRWVNRATRESVTVFWVGGGLTGWPGVAHGGALAMAFCEAFGAPSPAKLTLTYLAPTMASNFFVLRAAPAPPAPAPSTDLPPQKDMTKRPVPSEERPVDGGEEWSATLQAVQGRVCVKAKAVVPR